MFDILRAFEEETNIVLGVAREYSRLSSTLVARNVLQQTSQLGSVRWSVYRIQRPLPISLLNVLQWK